MFDRNAKPVEWLRKAHSLFLNRMSEIQNAASNLKVPYWNNLSLKKQNFQFNFEISNY